MPSKGMDGPSDGASQVPHIHVPATLSTSRVLEGANDRKWDPRGDDSDSFKSDSQLSPPKNTNHGQPSQSGTSQKLKRRLADPEPTDVTDLTDNADDDSFKRRVLHGDEARSIVATNSNNDPVEHEWSTSEEEDEPIAGRKPCCIAALTAATASATISPRQPELELPKVHVDGFVAAATFAGARAGMVFKRGRAGCGYYLDVGPSKEGTPEAPLQCPPAPSAVPPSPSPWLTTGGTQPPPATPRSFARAAGIRWTAPVVPRGRPGGGMAMGGGGAVWFQSDRLS